ncbi:ABC transporter substrate-binding protein [Egbenema bharatensis]|uniref:ABC transporter substrate-binding protein n=1 Tax=Egbenema bharatensis TaxID=3463334 RepID=UPI003A88F536
MNVSTSYRWTRRQTLWMLSGAMAGVALHGCQNPTARTSGGSDEAIAADSSELVSVAVGVTPWIGNTPLFIAQEKGFFRELGLDLNINVFQSMAQGFPAFTVGQLDAVTPVTSEVVSLAERGVDFRVVMVLDVSSGGDVILARNNIQTIEDFRGKQIAVELGGVGHFFVLQVLAEAGLTEQDVELINTPPDAGAAAYQAGNVEIAYSYSPFSDKANEVQPDGRTIFSTQEMPTAIADFFAFRTDFIEANPQAVSAFVEGNMRAIAFLETNRQEGLEIMAAELEITPEELDEQLAGIELPNLERNAEMLANPNSDLYMMDSLNNMAQFLQDQGQIDSIPDLSNVIDPQFVQALQERA